MTEYCTVFFTWEIDSDPNKIIEYVVRTEEECSEPSSPGILELGRHRLQVSRESIPGENDDSNLSDNRCLMTLHCKPAYAVKIIGFTIASEARIVEVYDQNDCYLQTVRGLRDIEDSEADGSRVHFSCHCSLQEPLSAMKVKFLSLGPRENFEIAHLRLGLQACSELKEDRTAGQGIDMARLRRDIDSMGDSVSERAKAFLETLESFQKSSQGSIDDIRQLLLNRSTAESVKHSEPGMAALLAMFSSVPFSTPPRIPMNFTQSQNVMPSYSASHASCYSAHEQADSQVNSVLLQMMSSMAASQGQNADSGKLYSILQSVCSQVSSMRDKEEAEQKHTQKQESSETAKVDELPPQMVAELDSLVESRMEAVEQRLVTRLDTQLAELESRVSSKLDAVLALLQNTALGAK